MTTELCPECDTVNHCAAVGCVPKIPTSVTPEVATLAGELQRSSALLISACLLIDDPLAQTKALAQVAANRKALQGLVA